MERQSEKHITILGAVEGILDEAVLKKLIESGGAGAGPIYGKRGKAYLLSRLKAYSNAARHDSPWVVLVDLDREFKCAPLMRKERLPAKPSGYLCFRVAVRAIEAWLLADRESFSKFLGVALSRIPMDPESEADPKGTVINLARKSRKQEIRENLVPRRDSGRREGPAYTSTLVDYVQKVWRPSVAARKAESLKRALACIRNLVELCRQASS